MQKLHDNLDISPDQMHEVMLLLKSQRGASFVHRCRRVRDGGYFVSIVGTDGMTISVTKRLTEGRSIRTYNEILDRIGHGKGPHRILDEEFFAGLDDDDEDEFFDGLDDDETDDFFAGLDDDDEDLEFDFGLPVRQKIKRPKS